MSMTRRTERTERGQRVHVRASLTHLLAWLLAVLWGRHCPATSCVYDTHCPTLLSWSGMKAGHSDQEGININKLGRAQNTHTSSPALGHFLVNWIVVFFLVHLWGEGLAQTQWLERWTGDAKGEGSNHVRSTRKTEFF